LVGGKHFVDCIHLHRLTIGSRSSLQLMFEQNVSSDFFALGVLFIIIAINFGAQHMSRLDDASPYHAHQAHQASLHARLRGPLCMLPSLRFEMNIRRISSSLP